MNWPMYYVQTQDGELHAYFRLDILLCDLAQNRDETVKLFRLKPSMIRLQYIPITEAELRKGAA